MKFVKAEKPVTTNHKTLGEISVDVETPAVDSIEEFVQFAGGTDAALDFINSAIDTSAKNGGRAALRNAPDGSNVDELRAKVQEIVRNYQPQAGGDKAPSKAKKAAQLDSIKAMVESGKEFTRDELLAMLSLAK